MPTRCLIAVASFVLLAGGLIAAEDKTATEVFGLSKVWPLHVTISADAWQKMQPTKRMGPFGGPKADPPPAAAETRKTHGIFALDFEYVKATMELGDETFPEVAVRYKGSGTYVSATGLKKPFKIDLDRYRDKQNFHGLKKLSLNNNAMDATAIREVLAYAVFRDLGVPAPRTAYAAVTLTVPGKYDREFVGLYVLAEPIEKPFLKDHFGSSKGLLLKPERVGPLEYLGEDWSAYESRYQPRTEPSEKAKRRLIEFTKLIQKADDPAFAAQIGAYLDVDLFLRFLAAHVALSSMDSFVGMGRNFYLYLNPKTNRFVFLPWDVDTAFGTFLVVGSPDALMDLSIRKPHNGRNRLIERLLADKKYYAAYAAYLETAVTKCLTVEGSKKDVALLKSVLDPLREREKKAALARHESVAPSFGGMFLRAPEPDVFVAKRIASVKEQLAGKRKGTEVGFSMGPPPGGFGPGQFLVRPILNAADKDKDGKLSQDEAKAAVQMLFQTMDADKKGSLDQKAVAERLDKILPGPRFPGGRAPAGFPTLGQLLAKPLMEKAGKDDKMTQAGFLAAGNKLFAEADKNNDGKLEEKELTETINKLFPTPRGR